MKRTQAQRLELFLRENPGASSLEVTLACGIVNVTGRVSDLRDRGIQVVCYKRRDGVMGYRIVEPRPVTHGIQEGLAL